MRHKRLFFTLLFVGLPALAACGNLESGDNGQQSTPTSGHRDSPPTSNAGGDTRKTTDQPAPQSGGPGSVRVARGGDTTTVEPTDVYCSGGPGKVRHLVAKTNHQLPLIKVEGTHFAMVKLDERGAPEKTNRPSGVTLGNDSVRFDHARIGSATLDGTLNCTKQQDRDDDDHDDDDDGDDD